MQHPYGSSHPHQAGLNTPATSRDPNTSKQQASAAQKSSAPSRPLLKPPKGSESQLPPCHTAALAQASPPHCQRTGRAGAGAQQGAALPIVTSLLEPMVPVNVQGTSVLSSSMALIEQPPITAPRAAVPLPPPHLPFAIPMDGRHWDRKRVTGDKRRSEEPSRCDAPRVKPEQGIRCRHETFDLQIEAGRRQLHAWGIPLQGGWSRTGLTCSPTPSSPAFWL